MMQKAVITWETLPNEIQREIVSYLDVKSLCFFARTSKRSLKNALPYLFQHQQKLLSPPYLSFTVGHGDSTFLHDTSTSLYACGYNEYGQLGLGHTQNCNTFTSVPLLENKVLQIATSYSHTLMLTDQGVFGCGDNSSGQLGLGHNDNCNSFTLIQHLPKAIQARWSLYRHIQQLQTLAEPAFMEQQSSTVESVVSSNISNEPSSKRLCLGSK